MLVCHCTLAGSQACRNCSRFIEYNGKTYSTPHQSNIPRNQFTQTWTKPDGQDEIIELLKKIEEKLGDKK
jgi:hypothetical protein